MQPLVYFDTNPFIYCFESTPEFAALFRPLMEVLKENPGAAVTSELVLGELLAPRRDGKGLPGHTRKRLYLDLLVWNKFFDLRPVTRDILIETADLRAFVSLKLPDAIHMVTAIHAGCRYFLSSDGDVRKGPRDLERVAPDAAGIETLLRALR
jgi:predicted nucleic acid-binding protein